MTDNFIVEKDFNFKLFSPRVEDGDSGALHGGLTNECAITEGLSETEN